MKLSAFFTLLLFCFSAVAQEEEVELPPLDPAFEGNYDMVIFNAESRLYAALLTQYKAPRNYQLIYGLDVEKLSILGLVRDADRVTMQTSRFNLQRLLRGEEDVEVTASIHWGDVRDGVEATYKAENITFSKLIYVNEIKDLEPSNAHQVYDIAEIKSDERLLIHRIKQPPSYVHLILQSSPINCIREFYTTSAVPAEYQIYNKLAFCGSLKPLYYDATHYQTLETNKR